MVAEWWELTQRLSYDSKRFFQGTRYSGDGDLHTDFQRANAFRTWASQAAWEQTYVSENFSSQLAEELSMLFQKVACE